MSENLSFTQRRLIEAVARGYCVQENGVVLGPKGRLKISKGPRQRYPTISTNWGGRVYGIPVHRLAAYCFYGAAALASGICVRHLNANTLDVTKANICLGTYSDNEHDKTKAARTRAAQAARATQGSRPKNAKLSDAQAAEIREFYRQQRGRKVKNGVVTEMQRHYGVSRTVLNKIANGLYYKDV